MSRECERLRSAPLHPLFFFHHGRWELKLRPSLDAWLDSYPSRRACRFTWQCSGWEPICRYNPAVVIADVLARIQELSLAKTKLDARASWSCLFSLPLTLSFFFSPPPPPLSLSFFSLSFLLHFDWAVSIQIVFPFIMFAWVNFFISLLYFFVSRCDRMCQGTHLSQYQTGTCSIDCLHVCATLLDTSLDTPGIVDPPFSPSHQSADAWSICSMAGARSCWRWTPWLAGYHSQSWSSPVCVMTLRNQEWWRGERSTFLLFLQQTSFFLPVEAMILQSVVCFPLQ